MDAVTDQPESDQADQLTKTWTEIAVENIWLVFPAILGAWVIYLVLVVTTSESWQVSGQFGDMFGAFTALVSGLAFAGIIIAIILQRKDLVLQREELRLQREELVLQRQELARSAGALEQQNATLRITAEFNARAALLGYFSTSNPGAASPTQRSGVKAVAHSEALERMLEAFVPPTNDCGEGRARDAAEGGETR